MPTVVSTTEMQSCTASAPPCPPATRPPNLLSGYLLKQSAGKWKRKRWNQRWFVLDREAGVLKYFRQSSPLEAVPLRQDAHGVLALRQAAGGSGVGVGAALVVQGDLPRGVPTPFCFTVLADGQRDVRLCADTSAEFRQWTSAISALISPPRKPLPSPTRGAGAAGGATASPTSSAASESSSQSGSSSLRSSGSPALACEEVSALSDARSREEIARKLLATARCLAGDGSKLILALNPIIVLVRFSGVLIWHASLLLLNALLVWLLWVARAKTHPELASDPSFQTAMLSTTSKRDASAQRQQSSSARRRSAGAMLARTTSAAVVAIERSATDPEVIPPASRIKFTGKIGGVKVSAGFSVAMCASAPAEPVPGCWAKIDASRFNVRQGPNYRKTKLKAASASALLELVAIDVYQSDVKIDNVGNVVNLDSLKPANDKLDLFIVNCQVPSYQPSNPLWGEKQGDGPGFNFVTYFAIPPAIRAMLDDKTTEPPLRAVKLLREFMEPSSCVSERFKAIGIVANPQEQRLGRTERHLLETYNGQPILTRPQHRFFRGDSYFEVDVDAHEFNYVARKGLVGVSQHACNMVLDFGFVLEGQDDSELPEQILGGVRLCQIDVTLSSPLLRKDTPDPAVLNLRSCSLAIQRQEATIRTGSASRATSLSSRPKVTSKSAYLSSMTGSQGSTERASTADHAFTAERASTAERVTTAERYEFIPIGLRHHFKVRQALVTNEESQEALAEREAVRCARRTRSALLVATSQSLGPPPVPTHVLYSNAIERAITARMTFARAIEGLDKYFQQQITKLKQLEEVQGSTILVPEWLCDGRVKLPTLVQTQRQIVNSCQGCLSDCDLYLGVYEALPSPPAADPRPVLRFVACSPKSKMLHQVLPCSLPQEPQNHEQQQVSSNQFDEPAEHEDSKTVSVQAMVEKSPLAVDDIAEHPPEEIHRFAPGETMAGPFACFPLLAGASDDDEATIPHVLGVISVDSCRKAQRLLPQAMSVDALYAFLLQMKLKDAAVEMKKAKVDGARFLDLTDNELRHKPNFQRLKVGTRRKLLELIRAFQHGSQIHLSASGYTAPRFFTQDEDALQFLEDVSKMAGSFLNDFRVFHWLREIANVTRNPLCTAYDVYDVLLRAVTHSLDSLERVAIWKITKKKLTPPSSGLSSASIPWEIDVMASTAVPEDRLTPFLDGQERKIKRITLFKEGKERSGQPPGSREGSRENSREQDACAPFIRGAITNIRVGSTSSSSAPSLSLPCERAMYHVAWADRSHQSLSWKQVRQFLPVRNMNAKHFQLRHLCQRLEQQLLEADSQHELKHENPQSDPEASCSPQPVRIKNPNALALVLRDASRPTAVKYALEIDFTAQFKVPQHVSAFLVRAVAIAEQSLACVRGREARAVKRERTMTRDTQLFQSLGLTPSADALRALQDIVDRIFHGIAANLPGVHLQIAELQGDGTQLKYTFVGNGSTLLGRSLYRGQGVSFRCLESKQPLVVGDSSELRPQLRRMTSSTEKESQESFPYIFVPLFHEDCAVGVLSIDSFREVPKGRLDESHPEAGVLEYLSALGKLLASAIYAKRRSYALHELQQAASAPLRSPQQLIYYACRALKDVLIGAWRVRVAEIDGAQGKTTLVYDLTEAEREQAKTWVFNVARPLEFRWKELLPDTIAELLKQIDPDTTSDAAKSVSRLLATIREGEQERLDAVQRYQELVAAESIDESGVSNSKRPAGTLEKAKLLERQVADKYFLLLNSVAEAEVESPLSSKDSDIEPLGAERITNERYVSRAMSSFLGTTARLYSSVDCWSLPTSKVFLTIAMLPQFHALCDQIYVQRVADMISRYLTALEKRVHRSRARTRALTEFRSLRDRALAEPTVTASLKSPKKNRTGRFEHLLSPAKELDVEALLQLQRQTIALIERTLGNPHVYFGLREPALRLLRYTSASKTSVMASKQLKHGHGVSFVALEKQIPIVVTRDSVNSENNPNSLFKRLRFFTNGTPETRKWPFIVVPIGDLGVLALDNMEVYEQEAGDRQPELGVVDFLRKVGQGFAEALALTRERMSLERQRLREDALVRVMTACEDFKQPSSKAGSPVLYLLHLAVQQLENALNGVDIYVGMVEPLCERIRFLCASTHSRMENQVVDTVESLSFRVFAQERTVVIPQLSQFMQQQQVQQQHASQSEAHPPRLRFFGSTAKLPRGPFVCVPIPFVGVLSVDTFPGAAGGVFSHAYPEDGVVAFLERVANHLGENLRTRAASETRKTLPTLFCGNRTTFSLLFQEILTLVARNMVSAVELRAMRFEMEQESGEWQEKATLASLRRSHTEPLGTISQDKHEHQEILRWLEERYSERTEEGGIQEQSEDEPSSTRVQQLRGYPEVLVVHCGATRDVADDTAVLTPTALVIRRVRGATWTYDEDFLLSIVPHIDALIEQVNIRVEAIVSRRVALQRLAALCGSLESLTPQEAVRNMRSVMLPEAMEIVAEALSKNHCDTYLGERESSGSGDSNASQLQLRFIAVSSRSLMQDLALNLANADNQSLTVVQCLQQQHPAQVILARNESEVRMLTAKKPERVFLVTPMGDNHVLCADSLGREAFVPAKRPSVEADVVEFLHASAGKLHEAILSTSHRASYDQLRQLTTCAHNDLRLFYSTVLDVLQRDLVTLHSQQIVSLGKDFTSAFRLEAWHGARTRRPITTLQEHFCSVCGCEKHLIANGVHSEVQTLLPMTNLPRTLDASRSSLQPAEGTEKRGSFACTCLATMLDAQVAELSGEPKLALCVFSHDVRTSDKSSPTRVPRRMPTAGRATKSDGFFTAYQRRYFFAFAAVATDVFTHVFRACALQTFAAEQLVILQERLDAKDGLVVRFTHERQGETDSKKDDAAIYTTAENQEARDSDDGGDEVSSTTASSLSTAKATTAKVMFSQQPNKYPRGKTLRGKLERKIRQFHASEAPLAIFMTRKAMPAPPSAAIKGIMSSSTTASAAAQEQTDKPNKRGPASLFGGRKLFGYNRKKKQEDEEMKTEQQRQMLLSAAPALQSLSPSRHQQTEQQVVTLHVFIRALEYQGRCDVLALTLEHQIVAAATVVEGSIRELKTQADAVVADFLSRPPRGDEEIHAKRFCADVSIPTLTDGHGGGGFLLMSLLKDARECFQHLQGALGAAVRQFLTGAQAIARVQVANLSTGGDGAPSSESNETVFDHDEDPVSSAAIALARVALVACGAKREATVALAPTDLLKDFLRTDAGKKLLQIEPTERKYWAALARARSLLRSFEDKIRIVREHPEVATALTLAPASKVTHSDVPLALQALLRLLLAQSAVVRYLKQLDAELARDHKRLRDAPAVMLQCFVRQKQAQKELAKRKREFLAARTIQCAFRQHLARRRLLFLKWTRAAIKVQRAYRKKRQRAKGSRPQGITAELLAVSQKYGAVGRPTSASTFGEEDSAAWRVDMGAFGSFQEYLTSKAGREQLKREEALMWRQRKRLEQERAQLPRDEALREDVGDLFELLDDAGSGELSRERTTALITRLHVPLCAEEVEDVVAMMDSDGSGGISMAEFLRWFAHEFPLLQRRAPRVCGVVTRRDWQWVIQQSARSALLKRWRATRAGMGRSRHGGGVRVTSMNDVHEEEDSEEEMEEKVTHDGVVQGDKDGDKRQ